MRVLIVTILILALSCHCEERGEKPIAPPQDRIELKTQDSMEKYFRLRQKQIPWSENVKRITFGVVELDGNLTAIATIDATSTENSRALIVLAAMIIGEEIKLGSAPIKRALIMLATPNGTASTVIPLASAVLLVESNLKEQAHDFSADCDWSNLNELIMIEKKYPTVNLTTLEKDQLLQGFLKAKAGAK